MVEEMMEAFKRFEEALNRKHKMWEEQLTRATRLKAALIRRVYVFEDYTYTCAECKACDNRTADYDLGNFPHAPGCVMLT